MINWEAVSAVGQIIGAIAVVISVVYLAVQVRSNARQMRLASMRSMSDAFNRWLQSMAENPHIGELWYRGMRDFDSFDGADLARYSALMTPRGGTWWRQNKQTGFIPAFVSDVDAVLAKNGGMPVAVNR